MVSNKSNKTAEMKAMLFPEVIPLLSTKSGKIVSDKVAADILGLCALDSPSMPGAVLAEAKRRFLCTPPGMRTRKTRDGYRQIKINIADGVPRLSTVFGRLPDSDGNRFAGTDFTDFLTECSELPYAPVMGQLGDDGTVMIVIEARPSASTATPDVKFVGDAPHDLHVKPSARGKTFTILHMACDKTGHLTFECPTNGEVLIEVTSGD